MYRNAIPIVVITVSQLRRVPARSVLKHEVEAPIQPRCGEETETCNQRLATASSAPIAIAHKAFRFVLPGEG